MENEDLLKIFSEAHMSDTKLKVDVKSPYFKGFNSFKLTDKLKSLKLSDEVIRQAYKKFIESQAKQNLQLFPEQIKKPDFLIEYLEFEKQKTESDLLSRLKLFILIDSKINSEILSSIFFNVDGIKYNCLLCGILDPDKEAFKCLLCNKVLAKCSTCSFYHMGVNAFETGLFGLASFGLSNSDKIAENILQSKKSIPKLKECCKVMCEIINFRISRNSRKEDYDDMIKSCKEKLYKLEKYINNRNNCANKRNNYLISQDQHCFKPIIKNDLNDNNYNEFVFKETDFPRL